MNKKSNFFNFVLMTVGFLNVAYADDQINPNKLVVLPQLESAFAPRSAAIDTKILPNPVNWPSSMDLSINVLGQMTIKAKDDITINKISVSVGGVTVGDNVNLKLTSGASVKYLIRTADFMKNLDIFKGDYKIIAIRNQVSATDYPGYDYYVYQIVKVTFDFTDSNKNFNEATNNFMLVVAK